MGTTTFYLRMNDLGQQLSSMKKSELKKFDSLSPYSKDNHAFGWHVPLELHNGNIYPLVFWRGRLIRLEHAPSILNRKYYSRFHGKTIREYEWTLLKKYLQNELEYLDKEFKKLIRKQKRTEKNKEKKS